MATKIRKEQLILTDFLKSLAYVDWTSDDDAASAAAIAAKIQSEIGAVSGSMVFKGAWPSSQPSGVKIGWTYVAAAPRTIGSGSGAVTLENGDTLIAKINNALITNPDHWVVVNVNITGAVTEANLATQLLSKLASGNANALSIAAGTGSNEGKVVLTVNFPRVTTSGSGSVVTGISINSTTGVITATKGDSGDMKLTDIVTEESLTPTTSGGVTTMVTASLADPNHFALYINGVRQKKGTDFTLSLENGPQQGVYFTEVTMSSGAYVPTSGDIVTCDYIKGDSRQYE